MSLRLNNADYRLPNRIQIDQSDLTNLNITLSEYLDGLDGETVSIQDASEILGVSPDIVKLLDTLLIMETEGGEPEAYSILRDRLAINPRYRVPDTEYNGYATSTMDLQEAVYGRYYFSDEQYRQTIYRLLDRNSVPDEYYRVMVSMVRDYPDLYNLFRDFKEDSLAMRLMELYYTDGDTPNRVQVLYSYAFNLPLVLEEDRRQKELSRLEPKYVDALLRIYDLDRPNEILDATPIPIEYYVIRMQNTPEPELRDLATRFGMYIPTYVIEAEVRGYILVYIHHYKDILGRPVDTQPISISMYGRRPSSVRDLIDALRYYTDLEIIEFFGYMEGFQNRIKLIQHIYRTLLEGGFIVYDTISTGRSLNRETRLSTDLEDLPGPYLVFGTAFEYRVYGLAELLGGLFDFTDIQLSRLLILLPYMAEQNSDLAVLSAEVLANVQRTLIQYMRTNQTILDFRTDVDRDVFYKMFFGGMYLRGWRGPGNPYPQDAIMTTGRYRPNLQGVLLLNEIYTGALTKLPIIDYFEDSIIIKREHLYSIVSEVLQTAICTKDVGRYLVLSGYYYLSLLFGEVIPDFNPYSMVRML